MEKINPSNVNVENDSSESDLRFYSNLSHIFE